MGRDKEINKYISKAAITGISVTSEIKSELTEEKEISSVCDKPMGILPLRDIVIFPFIPVPVTLGRESSIKLAQKAFRNKEQIFALLQKNPNEDDPGSKDLFRIGVVCNIINLIQLPDGNYNILLVGIMIAHLDKLNRKSPYLQGEVSPITEYNYTPDMSNPETSPLLASIDETYQQILNFVGLHETQDIRMNFQQFNDDVVKRINFMSINSPLEPEEKQELLQIEDFTKRSERFLHHLDLAFQKMQLKADIQMRTREDLNQQQKEMFLKRQLQAIQDELGAVSDDSEINELLDRAEKIKWNERIQNHFDKEVKKLERFNPQSPEYALQYTYLDTFLSLPWEKYSKDEVSLNKAQKILDRDHFGLDKVKERIVEHLAVLKLRGDMKAPIICLLGPPGVGKTSLGKSIAESMGREYVRISLGGLHDEAEIRGHRRTYIGAMPGRIISALQKCGSGNPVFVLDEIDKIGSDYKGDPSTALLEVLDPEQNVKFHDNFLDCDYDLSKILFVATANDISGISGPLRDRMEIIEVPGYIPEEKIEIARRHLLPKILEQHGFEAGEISIDKSALSYIINNYTRESGVRQLEKKIAKICRKIARLKGAGSDYPKTVKIKNVKEFLGKEEIVPELYENNDYAGVVTGLAWTSVGGEILFIETSLSQGKGKLTLTGNLGDVMKESAVIALQYLKSHAAQFGIDIEKFENTDVHIHVPEGAVPKDGPSAGITMTTSIASAFTGRKVRSRTAMTGEMTLRGKVLPVGGIREKILAAKRAGITDIILSKHNLRDIEEISTKYLQGLNFKYVDRIDEVLEFALLEEKAKY